MWGTAWHSPWGLRNTHFRPLLWGWGLLCIFWAKGLWGANCHLWLSMFMDCAAWADPDTQFAATNLTYLNSDFHIQNTSALNKHDLCIWFTLSSTEFQGIFVRSRWGREVNLGVWVFFSEDLRHSRDSARLTTLEGWEEDPSSIPGGALCTSVNIIALRALMCGALGKHAQGHSSSVLLLSVIQTGCDRSTLSLY